MIRGVSIRHLFASAALAAAAALSSCNSIGGLTSNRPPDRDAAVETLAIISHCAAPETGLSKITIPDKNSPAIILADGSTVPGSLLMKMVEVELEAADVDPPNWLLYTLMGHHDSAYRYAAVKLLQADPVTAVEIKDITFSIFCEPGEELPLEIALLANKWASIDPNAPLLASE